MQCASKLDLFALKVPDAPRLLFIGGRVMTDRIEGFEQFPRSSASGIAPDLSRAFESCVGEGAEYLSQLWLPDSPDIPADTSAGAIGADGPDSAEWAECFSETTGCDHLKQWLVGRNLVTDKNCRVPASLCVRMRTGETPRGLSTGCAAGESVEQAIESAILEIIERDAAALWWEGGVSPGPVSLETLAASGIESLFERAGRPEDGRTAVILDITTDIGIPTAAALSFDPQTGGSVACGLACRLSLSDAVGKAVLEMMQMELSHCLLKEKQGRYGDAALNEHDRRQLVRDQQLEKIWNTPLVQTSGRALTCDKRSRSLAGGTDKLLAVLKGLNYRVIAADLTSDRIGIPVVKVLIPGLQPYPSRVRTQRLLTTMERTGGTQGYTGGVSLL